MVAQIAAWRLERPGSRFRVVPLLAPLVAVSAVPLTILLAGPAAFLVRDPFVGEMRHFVAEGRSLPALVRQLGLRPLLFELGLGLLLVPAAVVVIRGRPAAQIVVGWLTLIVALLMAMTCFEVRWGRTLSAAQIVLVLGLVAVAARRVSVRRHVWLITTAALLLLAPAVQRIVVSQNENQLQRVAAGDLQQPLYRDIAATLRASQPEGDIILLASPNASAGISYFGRFQSLGTLFWENVLGLRAAAEIYSAATEEEARALLFARRVTHVAMISTTNFLGEYYQLLHPGSTPADARQSFGYRLGARQVLPLWLQPVPYRIPADLQDIAATIHLYKVVPKQTEAEQRYHLAIAQLATGDVAAAERSLEAAAALVPLQQRFALWETGGEAFYDYGADAAAVRLFRCALQLAEDPNVAVTAAWILATSRDPAVRDGVAALALAERVPRLASASPLAWSALAAANAEVGRFSEAVRAAERAVAVARAAGDAATVEILQKRLATFRAGQPWRQ
jgi:tetratricopeptide (TPR) repeat protein/multisubunit Na+/H+ antiporter MnhF subunit